MHIKGAAVNQDGKSTNLTAPNGMSQKNVVQSSLMIAGVSAEQVTCIEAHGTGTALGDPIEVSALSAVHAAHDVTLLSLGAIKSQIGHLEAVAGTAGLLRVVVGLQCSSALPNRHLKVLNSQIGAGASHMCLVANMTPLKAEGEALLHGISSFGMSGTNSHATLAASEERPETVAYHPNVIKYQHTPFIWWDPETIATSNETVPLLGLSIKSPGSVCWENTLSASICAFLSNHRVGYTSLAPGTGFITMARIAFSSQTNAIVSMNSLQFVTPLFLDEAHIVPPTVRTKLLEDAPDNVVIEASVDGSSWTTHAEMAHSVSVIKIEPDSDGVPRYSSLQELAETQPLCLNGERFYEVTGNDYQGEFRSIDSVWFSDHSLDESAVVISKIRFKTSVNENISTNEYRELHTAAWMDTCIQAGVLTNPHHNGKPYVFAGLEGCCFDSKAIVMDDTAWGLIIGGKGIVLHGQDQKPLGQMSDKAGGSLALMAPAQLQVAQIQKHLYETSWDTVSPSGPAAAEPMGSSLVWGHFDLACLLHTRCISLAAMDEICDALSVGVPSHAVFQNSLKGEPLPSTVLRLIQAAMHARVTVLVLTPVEQQSSIAGAWGLAKAVNAEVGTKVRLALIDTPGEEIAGADLIMNGIGDDLQLVVRGGSRECARMAKAKNILNGPVELHMRERGALSALSIQMQHTMKPAGILQANLEVKAVGLNFRDVLNVLGMYPGDPGPPGYDCSGVVSTEHTLPKIDSNEQVFGIIMGSLISFVAADPWLLAIKPTQWTYEQTSAMPTVYVTMWLAFEEHTATRTGSNELVHAATGGLGLVAVQYCNRMGARVVATAGRTEKQDYLRSIGIALLTTTRDTSSYRTDVQKLLGPNQKMNSLLNSLSHDDYIPISLSLLQSGSCFMEVCMCCVSVIVSMCV